MALTFTNSTDKVNHGGQSGILADLTTATYIIGYQPAAINTDAHLIQKGLFNGTGGRLLAVDNSGRPYISVDRTTDLNVVSAQTISTGIYYVLAGVHDPAATATDQRLYIGTLNTPMTEVSSYTVRTVGSGAVTSNAAADQIVGNKSNDSLQATGSIAFVAIFNRVLTLDEIERYRLRPSPHLVSSNIFYCNYGLDGTGTQADLSGNNNHGTVTGATQAAHPPNRTIKRYWMIPWATAGTALLEVIDETVNIDEANQRLTGLLRSIAEAVNIDEVIVRARTLARLIAETVNIDETAARLRTYLRSIGETVNIDEAAARLRTYLRAIDETVNIDEAVQRLTGLLRSIGETVNIDETIVRARTLARIIGETVNIDEVINRLKAMTRTVGETVNISETIVDVLTAVGNLLIHVIDEVVNVDEVTQRLVAMTRRIDETLNISEATSRAMSLVRRAAETVNIDEAINRAATWIRTIDETVNITETIARIRGMSKVIDETVNIGETVAGILGVVSGFIDATFKGMYRGMFRKMR